MAFLEITDLKLNLNGANILDGVTAEFWEGHIHAVVGPNGAGKSTLAGTIMGLSGYQHATGEILFEGAPLLGLDVSSRAALGITMAWQEPARFEGLTIADFIRAGAKDKSEDAIEHALREVGLDPVVYAARAADKTLSGGERKKVELASIVAMQPRLAVLDELDSGIDIESIQRIFQAVQALKELGTTVILITHSLEVLDQADHAFLLCSGQIVDKGSVDKIRGYFEGRCMPCAHQNVLGVDGYGEQL